MNIEINKQTVCFRSDNKEAGVYRLDDPFKPYFEDLRTPDGHNVVVVSPGDHRHHKGLMYGLVADDLNFWEEEPGSGKCGIQKTISVEKIPNGFRQMLIWQEEQGTLKTYEETRTVTCHFNAQQNQYNWNWKTHKTALRDHTLVQSKWAHAAADDRIINYHGLGIRLPWMWCFGFEGDKGAFGSLEISGNPVEEKSAHGTKETEVGIWGFIDGQWNETKARVTLSQKEGYAWYMVRGSFPYIAAGPTSEGPRSIKQGEVIEEEFNIRVQDIV